MSVHLRLRERIACLRMQPWQLWRRQIEGILRLELQRNFFTRRSLWIYLLALAPVGLTAIHTLFAPHAHCTLAGDYMAFATVFQIYYLRMGIFFGCVGIFMNLIRGEMLQHTLHYYLMTPVRREVLLVAKYAAGVVISSALFGGCVAASYLLIGSHFGQGWSDYLTNGPGGAHLLRYLAVTVLGCAGYGAVFLLAGVAVRNPMIPAAVVLVWESGNWLLPSVLKKFSVIFYLKSLCPVEVPLTGGLAILAVPAEPTPAWLAIPGLLVLSAVLLVLAARRARTLEINYGE